MIFAVLGKFAIIFPIFARDFLTCLDMIQCDEQHLVLEYGSVVWHHHLTHAQSDKLEALQKRAVSIILYPLTLPYVTPLGYLKLESLKHRQMEADKKFFNGISLPDNCLHHLLPCPRDTQLITRLRYANTYPVPLTKTKRFCSLSILDLQIM